LAPASFTSSAQRGTSRTRNAAKLPGVPVSAIALNFASVALLVSDVSPALIAALSFTSSRQ
jgi:hypothetical protein